jgi:hypothetical protein
MTKIQTFGPKEAIEDLATARGWRAVRRYEYYAEAVGSDGRSYYATGRSRPTPLVQDQGRWRQKTAEILEARMREEGVWSE